MGAGAPSSVVAAAALVLSISTLSNAQTDASPDTGATVTDSDPTRPVLFSIRPEIYKPSEDVTQAALIFRYDRATFVKRRWLPGRRGVIVRAELPMRQTRNDGSSAETGIGDAYAQILLVPYFTRRFAVVAGTGVIMPTATGERLGSGKWVLAPAAGPVWFLNGKGMVFVKFQNFTSIAGDESRPDANFFLITPTIIRVFSSGWWVLADSETKTNWNQDGRTGARSGLQLGHAVSSRFAVWIKPEAWWGGNSDGLWNLKFGLVWYR